MPTPYQMEPEKNPEFVDFGEYREKELGTEEKVSLEHREVAEELKSAIDGEVKFDDYYKILYATDASIYKSKPSGVVLPKSVEDVQEIVQIAAEHDYSIVPRGNGTSLNGNSTGRGGITMDMTKYMDHIIDIDEENKQATVEPGIVIDRVNTVLEDYGLKFAPDPASDEQSSIGGMIGNSSTGANSVKYGRPEKYATEMEVVLADGSLIKTRDIVLDSEEWDEIVEKDDLEAKIYQTVREKIEEHEDLIEERFPKHHRLSSGYNLPYVIRENEDGERVINLSKLFVGSEGTLGIVVSATYDLVETVDNTCLLVYHFQSLKEAMQAVPVALDIDATAVELMDKDLFDLAREQVEYSHLAEPFPEDSAAALMVQFDTDVTDDLEAKAEEANETLLEDGDAYFVNEAFTEEDKSELWALRKAAIPLLMGMKGDAKPYPFIEDVAVPPEDLDEYTERFDEILDEHGTTASFFAHAGVGVLHIRPILNLKTEEGIKKMHAIADDITDLAMEYHASFSGEHADGLARTEFLPKLYGDTLVEAFRDIKSAFDPDWVLNPGIIAFKEEPPAMTDNLRYGEDYETLNFDTILDWSDEGGFGGAVELCNGCGICRKTMELQMCPTFRVTKDEIEATRGRANVIRAILSGDLPEEELHSEKFKKEVLDQCLSCKACMSDCPTGVDLAKIRTELKYQIHKDEIVSRRSEFFSEVDDYLELGSKFAPVSNWVMEIPGVSSIISNQFDIADERNLPKFANTTFSQWFKKNGENTVSEATAEHKVVIFPDAYTDFVWPDAGKAAVKVLQEAGVYVEMAEDVTGSGRPANSKGFPEKVMPKAEQNVDALAPKVEEGFDVVFIEPSDSVMFQHDYLSYLDGEDVEKVSEHSYEVMEYVSQKGLTENLTFDPVDEKLAYQPNCNEEAMQLDDHAPLALEQAGYEMDPLDTSCCGMAGSYGYEDEHYEISKALAELFNDHLQQSDPDVMIAPGFSCRKQIQDMIDTPAIHPVRKLDEAIDYGVGS